MPRDIGPEMLANLDNQLSLGNIDPPTYEARKATILELIRKGRAIEVTTGDRVRKAATALAFFIVAILFGGMVGSSGRPITPVSGLVFLGLIGLSIYFAVKPYRIKL